MKQQDVAILTEFMKNVQSELAKVMPAKFAETMEVEAKENYVALIGSPLIKTVEFGRGPTVNKTPSTPTLREALLSWINKHSIRFENMKPESMAFIIARKIHKEGSFAYRMGIPTGKISNILNNVRIESTLALIAERYQIEVSSEIIPVQK